MIDAGARLSAQIAMMNEVLRSFAAVDFTGPPEAPRVPPPATTPAVAAGALAPDRADERGGTLPPVDARPETGDPEPGRSLDGLRPPTVPSGRPGPTALRPAGPDAQAAPREAPPAGAAQAEPVAPGPAASGPVLHGESGGGPAGVASLAAANPSDVDDRPHDGPPAAASPFPVPPRLAGERALRPQAPVRAAAAPTAEPAAGGAGDEAEGAGESAARPPGEARVPLRALPGAVPPRPATAPADVDHRRTPATEPRDGAIEERHADGAVAPEADRAPGPPAVVRHAPVADIDLRFFADAAAGGATASGAQDAAGAAAALVFNLATIPGWPPPRPFALPDAEGLLAGLLGSAHLAGDEDLAEGLGRQAGVPALAGNVLARLRDLPRARRRRALLGLMALMDTIETIIEAVEAELLALSRARRDEGDEDLAEAGSRRRWTA